MSISLERNPNGSYTASALVREPNTPFSFYESRTFYFYRKAEIPKLFREYLKSKNMKIQKD